MFRADLESSSDSVITIKLTPKPAKLFSKVDNQFLKSIHLLSKAKKLAKLRSKSDMYLISCLLNRLDYLLSLLSFFYYRSSNITSQAATERRQIAFKTGSILFNSVFKILPYQSTSIPTYSYFLLIEAIVTFRCVRNVYTLHK